MHERWILFGRRIWRLHLQEEVNEFSMSIVFQVLVSNLDVFGIFFWIILDIWRRFQRLIVIVVDTFSVFVYTVFIYLYAVMLLRQKFKNSKFTFPWIFYDLPTFLFYLLHWTTLRHECPDELKDCNSVIVQKFYHTLESLSEIDVLVYAAMTPNRAWLIQVSDQFLNPLRSRTWPKIDIMVTLYYFFILFISAYERIHKIFPLFLHNLHRNFIIPRLHTFLKNLKNAQTVVKA
jgi:hypothetical protein